MGCCVSTESAAEAKGPPPAQAPADKASASAAEAGDEPHVRSKKGSTSSRQEKNVETVVQEDEAVAATATTGVARSGSGIAAQRRATGVAKLEKKASKKKKENDENLNILAGNESKLKVALPEPNKPLEAHRQPSETRDTTKAAVHRAPAETPPSSTKDVTAFHAESSMAASSKVLVDEIDLTPNSIQETIEASANASTGVATALTAAAVAAPAAAALASDTISDKKNKTEKSTVKVENVATQKVDMDTVNDVNPAAFSPSRHGLVTPTKQVKVPPIRLPRTGEEGGLSTGQVLASGVIAVASISALALALRNATVYENDHEDVEDITINTAILDEYEGNHGASGKQVKEGGREKHEVMKGEQKPMPVALMQEQVKKMQEAIEHLLKSLDFKGKLSGIGDALKKLLTLRLPFQGEQVHSSQAAS